MYFRSECDNSFAVDFIPLSPSLNDIYSKENFKIVRSNDLEGNNPLVYNIIKIHN